MKTWEMIKELTENPKKKFINRFNHVVFAGSDDFIMMSTSRGSTDLFRKSINEDSWEEVKEPVTWQEALQAWVNYKDIYCKEGGTTYVYRKNEAELTDQEGRGVSASELEKGKWYIED